MSYEVEEKGLYAIITFKGNILGGNELKLFRESLHSLCDKGIVNVIVDLSKVRVMNSSGIGMLIAGLTTLRKAGGELRIANADKRIEGLLIVTRLITVFKHYTSLKDAIKSFEKEGES